MTATKPLTYAIDFGTSNSLLAATDGDKVLPPIDLDPGAKDHTVLKSLLYSPSSGTWFFGAQAITEYGEHAADGRIFRSLKKYLPDASFTGTLLHGRNYNLAELIAIFLRELRQRANQYFNQDVTGVVLGRPASFGLDKDQDALAQKRLTTAAELAGFKQVDFCPEPVAAAYEFRHQLTERRTVLIADFGGGTSDFTVVNMSRERFTDQDVLATHGISIAGDRFDGAIMKHMVAPHFGTKVTYRLPLGSVDLHLPQHVINRLCSPADIAFLSQRHLMQLLKDAQKWALSPDNALRMQRLFTLVDEHLGYKVFKEIEKTKIALSADKATLFQFEHPGISLAEEVYSADFVTCSADLVVRIVAALDETLARAGVKPEGIDIVCCTGGTAQLPALNFELVKRFGENKLRQHRYFHSVINGLAERALALRLGTVT